MDKRAIKQRVGRITASLEKDYNEYKPFWQGLAEYSNSLRGKFIGEDRFAFMNRSNKIIDNTMNHSLNILSSGLQSGLTNQTSRWFKFSLGDKDLLAYKPVKQYLQACEDIIYTILAKGNFYKLTPSIYKELGLFGQPCVHHSENVNSISHFTNFTCGEYMLASDGDGQINTCARIFGMSVEQIVTRFGIENVSSKIKEAYDSGSVSSIFNVVHVILPNFMMNKGKIDNKNKPFMSVYYLQSSNDNEVLSVSGYDRFPIHAPRWETVSNEVYGISPAMNALGVTKSLQKFHELRHLGAHYQADPVKNVPMSLFQDGNSPDLLPGGVVAYDDRLGSGAVTSAMNVNFDINAIREIIAENKADIHEAMFSDVFKMIANTGKTMSATEVLERQEEKMVLLGPVLHNVITEFLTPTLNLVFNNAKKLGALPIPPDELDGVVLDIEYQSVLAQAQQMLSLGSSQDFISFVGSVGQFDPNALKKINTNKAIDDFAEKRGVNPNIVNSNEEVEEMLAIEAEQAQQMQQVEMAKQALEGAKTLSEIDISNMGGLM